MIELVVAVCLLEDPSRCKEVALVNPEEGMTSMQCMMGAMPEIAQWVDTHPRWQMKSWTCRKAGTVANL